MTVCDGYELDRMNCELGRWALGFYGVDLVKRDVHANEKPTYPSCVFLLIECISNFAMGKQHGHHKNQGFENQVYVCRNEDVDIFEIHL